MSETFTCKGSCVVTNPYHRRVKEILGELRHYLDVEIKGYGVRIERIDEQAPIGTFNEVESYLLELQPYLKEAFVLEYEDADGQDIAVFGPSEQKRQATRKAWLMDDAVLKAAQAAPGADQTALAHNIRTAIEAAAEGRYLT